MLLAALLAVANPTSPALAIAQLYHDACVTGELKLPKDQVLVLTENRAPNPPGRPDGYRGTIETASYLWVKRPVNAYVNMITFRAGPRSPIVSSCSVVTAALRRDQAFAIFRASSPTVAPEPVPEYLDQWQFNFPQLGYRKRFSFVTGGWAYFTTEIYRKPPQKPAEPEGHL